MKHIYKQNDPSRPIFVLLHDTDGNERDLIPLAEMIDPQASYLGVLGEVLEQGMPRFFKRLAEGVFDEEDLVYRTNQLHDFLQQAAVDYKFDFSKIVLVGYSNGANMVQSLLLHYPSFYRYAMMHHPMNVKKDVAFADLSHVNAFIGAGSFDPLCPIEETYFLEERLLKAHAKVHVHVEMAGHELTRNELIEAIAWYQKLLL
jgi:phospholipase/carboxylesterase